MARVCVPRCDGRTHADGLVREQLARAEGLLELEAAQHAHELAQVGEARGRLRARSQADGCAHLGADGLGHLALPRRVDGGQLLEHRKPLLTAGRAPRRQGALGGADSRVDVGRAAEGDGGDRLLGGRVDHLVRHDAFDWRDPLAVDVERVVSLQRRRAEATRQATRRDRGGSKTPEHSSRSSPP